jgi:hypothetical protein
VRNLTVETVNGSYLFVLHASHFGTYSLKFEISGSVCHYVKSLPCLKGSVLQISS